MGAGELVVRLGGAAVGGFTGGTTGMKAGAPVGAGIGFLDGYLPGLCAGRSEPASMVPGALGAAGTEDAFPTTNEWADKA